MIAPPVTAERILEALSAKTVFRDGVVGDLAEEFALRAARDGAAAARRWYYREAVRSAPHLVHDWARSLTWSDMKRTASIVGASYLIMLVLAFFALLTFASGAIALQAAHIVAPGPLPLQIVPVVELPLLLLYYTAGGYVAAWLDTRTPLISAIALGIVCATIGVALSIALHRFAIYRASITVVMITGTTFGGILHVAKRRPPAAAPHRPIAS